MMASRTRVYRGAPGILRLFGEIKTAAPCPTSWCLGEGIRYWKVLDRHNTEQKTGKAKSHDGDWAIDVRHVA